MSHCPSANQIDDVIYNALQSPLGVHRLLPHPDIHISTSLFTKSHRRRVLVSFSYIRPRLCLKAIYLEESTRFKITTQTVSRVTFLSRVIDRSQIPSKLPKAPQYGAGY
jgi:hypothetical protein